MAAIQNNNYAIYCIYFSVQNPSPIFQEKQTISRQFIKLK